MNLELKELSKKNEDLKENMKLYITKTNLFDMIPSPKTTRYRNNIMFSIGKNNLGEIEVGPFESINSKVIMKPESNLLVSELCIKVCNTIKQYIIEQSKLPVTEYPTFKGFWRHIHIRHNMQNDFIICFRFSNFEEYCEQWKIEKYGLIDYIFSKKEIYDSKYNLIKIEYQLCYGKSEPNNTSPYYQVFDISDLYERMINYLFSLNIGCFYQVNMYSSKYIYNIVKKLVLFNKKTILFDLCCGIGIYSIILSNRFRRVYGVDNNNDNIKFANKNKELNKVDNIKFINDRVENVLKRLIISNPDRKTIIVNPPRRGLYEDVLKEINKNIKFIDQIIYISCNVKSLKRDLSNLDLNNKKITHIIPINQFPNTEHYEIIVNIN